MIKIRQVDIKSKAEVNKFVQIPFRLYKDHPQWVPRFLVDVRMMMNPKKHPFYEHSEADFFTAERDGEAVGRNQEVANALFEKVIQWAKNRGMNKLVGPKGFGPLDGYGIQIEGFEHRQMMNMMNYNYPYYRDLVENLGFTKVVDFVSSYMKPEKFQLPEKVRKASEIAQKRGTFEVLTFKNKRHLRQWAGKIGQAYNKSFVKNWEYYPLSKREINFVLDNVMTIVDPNLMKVILKDNEVVGFVFPFPDVSRAMQKNKGKLGFIEILRLFSEIKKTDWISFNGVGILPEYQGLGGNAIIYDELEKALHENRRFVNAELTQVAETAVQMRKDLLNLGVKFYKNHRVYQKDI